MSTKADIHGDRAGTFGSPGRAITLNARLPEDLTVLWETFSHLWRDGRRREAYDFLPSLMEAWSDCDGDIRRRFARECCRIAFTTETAFPLAHRLLVEVMLPYLVYALEKSIMPDMIWVVEAKRNLYGEFVDKYIGSVSNFHLLKKALKLEPNHPRAARLLLDDLMYNLDYCAHEMPAGYVCTDDDVERTLQLLAQALDIAAAAPSPDERIFFMKHKRLFEAWKKYRAVSPDIDFDSWCRQSNVAIP